MGKKFDFDYIVIGGGPAGSTIALGLAKAKKKVALVESSIVGGPDINYRDILFEASLRFAKFYREIKMGAKYGFVNLGLHFNMPTLLNWQERVIETAARRSRENLKNSKVEVITGAANFLSANEIAVGEHRFTAKYFIIATGAKLKKNSITGCGIVPSLSPERALRTRGLPKAVAIVGGGKTGCELAQYFASLSSKVLLFEMSGRLLPKEDSEVGEKIADYFTNKMGISVFTKTKVVAIEKKAENTRVIFTDGGIEKATQVDAVIMATGYEPVTGIGLENAGVKYKKTGIIVDDNFRTTTKNIYAIGDAISAENSTTERANYQAVVLLSSLLSKSSVKPSYDGISRIVRTCPAVATVGFNENDLLKRDVKYKKIVVPISEAIASVTEDFGDGFIKLIANKKDVVIGATIVAPNAQLLIQELALVVRNKNTLLELASTPHIVGTFGETIKIAAKKLMNKK